jgi:hypothetical protein
MAKKKDNYPTNAWEYTDWLYTSGRITSEEHITLKSHLLKLEEELLVLAQQGC